MFNHLLTVCLLSWVVGTQTKERATKLVMGMNFPRRARSITTSAYDLPGYSFRLVCSKSASSGDDVHSHTLRMQNPHSVYFVHLHLVNPRVCSVWNSAVGTG